jgi:hypothetical protein
MPVSSIALQMAKNSHSWPMQSLKPAGLPPDSRRISAMKRIISTGVEKAEWRDGEMQSWPIGTPLVSEISSLTLGAGSTPPWPGLAPWLSFSSTILTCGSAATSANFSREKVPSGWRVLK